MGWIGVAAFVVILVIFFSIKASDAVVHYSNDNDPDRYIVSRDYYESLNVEPVRLYPIGYEIAGDFVHAEGSKKAVILVHGITASRKTICDYAELFHKKGYNLLLFDLPNHGSSGGDHRSFGFFEKKAVLACFNFLRQRLGEDASIGLWGISMGGATALLAAAARSDWRFVIADCPYEDLSLVLADHCLRKAKIVPRRLSLRFARDLMAVPSFVTYLRFGWRFTDCAPIDQLDKIQCPLLLIHGIRDRFVRCYMSEDLHKKRQTLGLPSQLELFEAAHGGSFHSDSARYDRVVSEFLDQL